MAGDDCSWAMHLLSGLVGAGVAFDGGSGGGYGDANASHVVLEQRMVVVSGVEEARVVPTAERQMSFDIAQTSWLVGIRGSRPRLSAWLFYVECRAVLVCRVS